MKPPLGPGRMDEQENEKQERTVKKNYVGEKVGKRDNRGIRYTEGRWALCDWGEQLLREKGLCHQRGHRMKIWRNLEIKIWGGGRERERERLSLPQPRGGVSRGRRANKVTLGETVLECEAPARTWGWEEVQEGKAIRKGRNEIKRRRQTKWGNWGVGISVQVSHMGISRQVYRGERAVLPMGEEVLLGLIAEECNWKWQEEEKGGWGAPWAHEEE